jgi:AbiTii
MQNVVERIPRAYRLKDTVMLILWYGLVAAFLGSLVTSICTWLWYRAEGGNEPFYGAISASVVAVLSGIGLVVEYFANRKRGGDQPPKANPESLLLDWLLTHVPSEDLSKTLPKALNLAKMVGDKDFEKWILCEVNGYSPRTMVAPDVVPEYRTIPIVHMDMYKRPLIIDDPSLSFVNQDRLCFGVRELEAYAKRGGMLFGHDPRFVASIKENMHVDVVQYQFNTASIFGILEAIRSQLLDRLHGLRSNQANIR